MTTISQTDISQTAAKLQQITIYHSPDADDAFMFYGIVSGNIDIPGYEFDHALSDIESLNHRTLKGEPLVTAISVHALAYCADNYAVLRCGASMGGVDYGPRLVSLKPLDLTTKRVATEPLKIATPGELTSATLTLKLYLREKGIDAQLVDMNFNDVQQAVTDGVVDCGLIIHEGQITHQREGFTTLLDLGEWWWGDTNLPLPLGVNVVRKDLGVDAAKAVYSALRGSIEYSLRYREEALNYALGYGRGLSFEDADKFVEMYVNQRTIDMGADGIESIKLLLSRGAEAGLIPAVKGLEFI